ncbi:hypothetical protein CLU96_1376 [Chryseobacterium sp. 52]|nr:hypothetical protein CLU96_1376 [Chryseobacterium sp. 52]
MIYFFYKFLGSLKSTIWNPSNTITNEGEIYQCFVKKYKLKS